MIYTDEDKIDEQGYRYDPAFKPNFSIELQLGCHLTGRLAVYRRTLIETIVVSPRAIRRGQEQALAVQVAARCGSAQIRHIPRRFSAIGRSPPSLRMRRPPATT